MASDRAELREALAELEHNQWAVWTRDMLHMLAVEVPQVSASRAFQRWQGQAETAYSDLTEREKDVDREWADRVLALLGGVEDG